MPNAGGTEHVNAAAHASLWDGVESHGGINAAAHASLWDGVDAATPAVVNGMTAKEGAHAYDQKQRMFAAQLGGVSAVSGLPGGTASGPAPAATGLAALTGGGAPGDGKTKPEDGGGFASKPTGGDSKILSAAAKAPAEDPAKATAGAASTPASAVKEDPKIQEQRAKLADLAAKATTPEDKESIAAQKRALDIKSAPVSDGAKDALTSMYEKAGPAKTEIDALADNVAGTIPDAKVSKAGLKGVARVVEKAQAAAQARGSDTVDAKDLARIKDIARNTIVVPSDGDIDKAVNAVCEAQNIGKGADGKLDPSRVKQYKADEDACGYSGVNITMQTANGHRAETQVNTAEMIYAKEKESDARAILGKDKYEELQKRPGMPAGGGGHSYYEDYRQLDPKSPDAIAIAEQSKAYYASVRNPVPPQAAVA